MIIQFIIEILMKAEKDPHTKNGAITEIKTYKDIWNESVKESEKHGMKIYFLNLIVR